MRKKYLLLIIILAFALRLYRLDAQSLWFDEIVIVALARVSWYQGFLAALGQGIQLTPVFHGIIKLWLAVGDSDWLVRMPAVLFGVLTIPLVFKLGQLYFNDKVGLITAFIFALNPYQVWFSQELKLYALLPFVGGGAMYAFGLMVKTRGQRGIILLTLFNLIGLPAHYFMFLISAVQFLYLLINLKRTYTLLRWWLLTQVVGVLPLVFWWLFIIRQQHFAFGIGWIPSPRWFAPFLTFWNFTYIYTGKWSIIAIVALLVALVGLIFGLRDVWRKSTGDILLPLWLFFPPVIVLLMSFGRNSFYVDRYFLIVSPILTLLIVSGLLSLRTSPIRWGMILIFILTTGLGLWQIYFDQTNFSKEDWRTLARTIDAQAQPGQMVITCTDGQRLSFAYYNPQQTIKPENTLFAAQLTETSVSEQAVWMVNAHPRLGTHYLSKTLPPDPDKNWLSPESLAWEINHRQNIITVAGLSAYQYEPINAEYLPEIVEWRCQD